MPAAAPPPAATATTPGAAYRRHQPETAALYEVVRDDLETLWGAIDDGAIAVRIPKHARKELEAYLGCGLLCRGFALLRCQECGERLLVAGPEGPRDADRPRPEAAVVRAVFEARPWEPVEHLRRQVAQNVRRIPSCSVLGSRAAVSCPKLPGGVALRILVAVAASPVSNTTLSTL